MGVYQRETLITTCVMAFHHISLRDLLENSIVSRVIWLQVFIAFRDHVD